eukprot:TRINITY_DN2466_c0_g1_i1.p1 TRINITY_DN2466_c0_g1~~TRINITY_DN2466_c0_g1_i1.p1  ORF type:complete len:743 (+),score=120.28 TRINITY_DN2466_c0_g1_i1:94-2322(+)
MDATTATNATQTTQLPPSQRRRQTGARKIISYGPLEVTDVQEMMQPLRPLVKSKKPLTVPKGPGFESKEARLQRKLNILEKREQAAFATAELGAQTLNRRKLLKAHYEFEREKRIAQKAVYRMAKLEECCERYHNSPFLTDLLAESDDIEHMKRIRNEELKALQKVKEQKKKQLRTEVIIKALTEVDDAEERRTLHRRNLAATKLEKAFRDVHRSELRSARASSRAASTPPDLGATSSSLPSMSAAGIRTPSPPLSEGARGTSPMSMSGTGQTKPMFILQREQELAERARLEKEAQARRLLEAQALEEALRSREEEEMQEHRRMVRHRQKVLQKQQAELEERRRLAKASRAAVAEQIKAEVDREWKVKEKKEIRRQQLAQEWKEAALAGRSVDNTVAAYQRSSPKKKTTEQNENSQTQDKEIKEIKTFPPPPPKVQKKDASQKEESTNKANNSQKNTTSKKNPDSNTDTEKEIDESKTQEKASTSPKKESNKKNHKGKKDTSPNDTTVADLTEQANKKLEQLEKSLQATEDKKQQQPNKTQQSLPSDKPTSTSTTSTEPPKSNELEKNKSKSPKQSQQTQEKQNPNQITSSNNQKKAPDHTAPKEQNKPDISNTLSISASKPTAGPASPAITTTSSSPTGGSKNSALAGSYPVQDNDKLATSQNHQKSTDLNASNNTMKTDDALTATHDNLEESTTYSMDFEGSMSMSRGTGLTEMDNSLAMTQSTMAPTPTAQTTPTPKKH